MGTSVALTLASNVSATGNWVKWPGGSGVFSAEATWGGGTVKLQYQGPNGTAIDVGTDTTLTANGGGVFTLAAGYIRASVATATAVYASAKGVG